MTDSAMLHVKPALEVNRMNMMTDIRGSAAMGKRWCVAVTIPRAERIAQMQAIEAGVDVFLPLREEAPTHEKPIVIVPVWPGYIFLATAAIPETMRAARRIISRLDGAPIFVPSGLVESYMDRADADGLIEHYVPEERYSPLIGDRVRLLYGAYAGQFATIKWCCGQALKLELSCAASLSVINAKLEQVTFAGRDNVIPLAGVPARKAISR